MARNRLTLLGAIAALVVLVADQGSKWWILHALDLPEIGQIVLFTHDRAGLSARQLNRGVRRLYEDVNAATTAFLAQFLVNRHW